MPSNVTAEEASALAQPAEGAARQRAIAARDFREPRRLAPAELERIARVAACAIPEIEGSLRVWLRGAWKVRIESVHEVNSRLLLDGVRDPYFLLAFQCANRPCWAMWDPAMASAAAELALGAVAVTEPKARDLSSVELGVLRNLVGRSMSSIAQALGVRIDNIRSVLGDVQLALERADAREADPTRIAVQVALSGPIGESTLRFYIAGVTPPQSTQPTKEAASAKDKKRATTPEHLASVPFVVSGQLGTSEVELADLLRLEPGDVIPLSVAVDSPLTVYVDGVPCASARFGDHKGRLTLQLIDFRAPNAEQQT